VKEFYELIKDSSHNFGNFYYSLQYHLQVIWAADWYFS